MKSIKAKLQKVWSKSNMTIKVGIAFIVGIGTGGVLISQTYISQFAS